MKNQQYRDEQDQQQTYGWTLHMLDLHTTLRSTTMLLLALRKLDIIDLYTANYINTKFRKNTFDDIRVSKDGCDD
jgi:hypothetical protein